MSNETGTIRLFLDRDEEAVVRVWHRAGQAEYTYLPTWQAFSLEQAAEVFRSAILGENQIWVGVGENEAIVAFMAINGTLIDRMYVDPEQQRSGWGTRLLNHAKTLSPQMLELYTHQENVAARAFYEKHGFKAISFGVSPPPESAPDVKYRWLAG